MEPIWVVSRTLCDVRARPTGAEAGLGEPLTPFTLDLVGVARRESWAAMQLRLDWVERSSERMLCHEHATNRILLADRHRKLTKLIPKVKVPSAEAEAKDPKAALEVYAACVDKLRGHARTAKEKHPHVHSENIHYGFRRNLWGVKPHGITMTAIALVIVGAQVVGQLMSHQPIRSCSPLSPPSTSCCSSSGSSS